MFDFKEKLGLFDDFEVNHQPFWPRVKWLLAGSLAWHALIVTCIMLIPPVRDALSIAFVFSGGRFVDRPYSKTNIARGDILEITTEKFHYPEGYFAMDQLAMPSPTPIGPAFSPRAFNPSTASAGPSPSPIPSISPGASPLIAANTDKEAKPNPSPAKNDEDKLADQAQQELIAASKKTGIDLPQEGEINKAPFKDLGAFAAQLRDQGKLDFNKPFEVAIDTSLDKDGKLVKPTVSRRAGDDTLVELGTRLVAAMNDSGVLVYLKKINKDKPDTKVVFTIKQDGTDVVATVESEVSSADSARIMSKDFAIMLLWGAASRKGHDEAVLMNNTKVTSDGNKLVFKLTMAHQDVVDIVKKGMATPTPSVTPS